MVIGALFEANLNADKIFIDMTYLADPIKNKFWLKIQNQSLAALYFKILCDVENWSLNIPADGKLGGVGAGLNTFFIAVIQRSKPAVETTDTGSLKIEAYTDSGYTNKIGEDSLTVTIYIEDLENWTDVTKNDFDDGTAQGWTGNALSIENDESVEVGGYSARQRMIDMGSPGGDLYIEKPFALPDRNKVRVSFFLSYIFKSGSLFDSYLNKPYIKANGTKIYYVATSFVVVPMNETYTAGWIKFCADLSAYKGQTVTVRIGFEEYYASRWGGDLKLWRDRIVVAGKN